MDVYKEVSREIGQQKLALQYSEPVGTEASCAGKMKTRKKRTNAQKEGFMGVMAGHRDYLSMCVYVGVFIGYLWFLYECLLVQFLRSFEKQLLTGLLKVVIFIDIRNFDIILRVIITCCLWLLVLELLRRGANVTRPDSKGRTALHFAATRGDANLGMS